MICDLSGEPPNPNVMYELGVRLTCSTNPVILIREQFTQNRPTFDIAGFHTHSYDPLDYASLAQYLRQKISRFETGEETFRSPVLSVLGPTPTVKAGRERLVRAVNMLEVGLYSYLHVLTNRLREFFGEDGAIQLTGNAFTMADELRNAWQARAEVDLTDLRIVFGPHPVMTYFLSDQPLGGVIDFALELKIDTDLMAYHMNYFLEATWWFRATLGGLISFADQTKNLMVICRLLAQAIGADSTDEQEERFARLRNYYGLPVVVQGEESP